MEARENNLKNKILSIFMIKYFQLGFIIFLTEITSNVATTSTFLPVVGAVAISIGVLPISLTIPVVLAASCAFMLPVATPPNAVVFGSGYLRIPDMVRVGIWMNLLSILLLTLFVYFILPYLWDFDPLNYIVPTK